MVDAENWMAHAGTASSILNVLRHPKMPSRFVILSGDVHDSFVYDAELLDASGIGLVELDEEGAPWRIRQTIGGETLVAFVEAGKGVALESRGFGVDSSFARSCPVDFRLAGPVVCWWCCAFRQSSRLEWAREDEQRV
jgi:hypothetical protein